VLIDLLQTEQTDERYVDDECRGCRCSVATEVDCNGNKIVTAELKMKVVNEADHIDERCEKIR
jgi:hypothetical protein